MRAITERDLKRREGVELVGLAGVDAGWSMPVALWHAPKGFDTRAQPDNQPFHVIALRLSGGGVQRVDRDLRRPERLPSAGFSVHPASNELRFIAPSEIRFAHIYVTENFLQSVFRLMNPAAETYTRFVREDRIMYQDMILGEQLDTYVKRAFDASDPPIAMEMESRANLIALQFLRKHSPTLQSSQRQDGKGRLAAWQLRRACDFMTGSLAAGVSLPEIAKLTGLSPEHFCRSFHRTTGLPPQRWMLARRMELARELLTRSDASLTVIAQELGYAGQSAFGVAFRKATGMTPSQFRRDGV